MHRFHQGHGSLSSQSKKPPEQYSQIMDRGFSFSKKLVAHGSCVNATSFSSGSGRWLASGGDDLRVLLWDFHQEKVDAPCSIFTGHTANIFCLAFSPQNQYIYSGSMDSTILKFEISRGSSSVTPASPIRTITGHEAIVRGVSCSPYSEDVFLSAGEDGRVIMNDSRVSNSSSSPGILQVDIELTDVACHPEAEKLFLTSDSAGNICLRDTRMAFDSMETGRTRGGVVQQYLTKLARRSDPYLLQPEVSSIKFDKTGQKFAAVFLRYLPTIYATSDEVPLAVCSGKNLPDGSPIPNGQSTYANSCTIKHGSFGGPASGHDEYFCTGSEDFRAYCWKIPDLKVLEDERIEMESDEWEARSYHLTTSFQKDSEGGERYYGPMELDTPVFRLTGHSSIVNSAVFNPVLPQVVTAGVEKYMVVHNPTPTAPNGDEFEATSQDIREITPHSEEFDAEYRKMLIFGPPDPFDPSISESEVDEKTLKFFDGVIRENEGSFLG